MATTLKGRAIRKRKRTVGPIRYSDWTSYEPLWIPIPVQGIQRSTGGRLPAKGAVTGNALEGGYRNRLVANTSFSVPVL